MASNASVWTYRSFRVDCICDIPKRRRSLVVGARRRRRRRCRCRRPLTHYKNRRSCRGQITVAQAKQQSALAHNFTGVCGQSCDGEIPSRLLLLLLLLLLVRRGHSARAAMLNL